MNRTGVYPGDYAVKRANGRKCSLDLEQEKYGRILYGWEAAVEAAIKALAESVDSLPERERSFRVGFVIDGDQRAEHLSVGSQRFFLLNPREVKASVPLTDIGKDLLAFATHEVAHIFFDHGERFDALWMDLMFRVSLSELIQDDRLRCVQASNRALALDLKRRRTLSLAA